MENRLKILISEDCLEFDREALDMFKHYSMDLSFLPKDGFKIIEIIENTCPDIVVMDLFIISQIFTFLEHLLQRIWHIGQHQKDL